MVYLFFPFTMLRNVHHQLQVPQMHFLFLRLLTAPEGFSHNLLVSNYGLLQFLKNNFIVLFDKGKQTGGRIPLVYTQE